jgi:predicted RNA-binding Zn-ribbon protein involved in translation (DUF1610 family)
MNSDEQRECSACGQRVVHVKVAPGDETNGWGQGESLPCDPEAHGCVPAEVIRELMTGTNDWICPVCGEKVQDRVRPKPRLQLAAQLLLACNVPLAGACMILLFALANRLKAMFGLLLGGRLEGMLLLLPCIVLSGLALSLPRVVVLRCPTCGSVHRQYHTPPGFFSARRKK